MTVLLSPTTEKWFLQEPKKLVFYIGVVRSSTRR
jgi:hypothetical protein